MEKRLIGSHTELYIGEGETGWITESYPTCFRTFHPSVILSSPEEEGNWTQWTNAQKTAWESNPPVPATENEFSKLVCRCPGVTLNLATGYYELNELNDITEEQMRDIYRYWSPTAYYRQRYWGARIRTNIPVFLRDVEAFVSAFYGSSIETVRLGTGSWIRGQFDSAFRSCGKLRKILDTQLEFSTDNDLIFDRCAELEEVRVKFTGHHLYFRHSPKLSWESVNYLVTYSYNAAGITVHLHANTYAKLTCDLTNAACAALTEEEREQWASLVEAAAAKNITFTTD